MAQLKPFIHGGLWVLALLTAALPASAQIELSGAYSSRMYEDSIERGPGEFMGHFTGMPLSDEGVSQEDQNQLRAAGRVRHAGTGVLLRMD
jgi:hypothetical protein